MQAIESVRMQTYPHWELCLVCDGGKPVDDIVEKFNDSRIIFQKNRQNKGYGHTANTAFSLSSGEYIAYLGDDDIWKPDHLERLLTALLAQNDAGFAYANSLCIQRQKAEDGSLHILKEYIPYYGHINVEDILEYNEITGISTLHKRELFEKVGGFDEQLQCLIDFDLWRRILCFSRTVYVNEVTSLYYEDLECARDHLTNLAIQNPLRYKIQQLRILGKKLPNGMEDHFKHSLAYLRHKHFFVYASARKSCALERGDVKEAEKFSKILAGKPFSMPAPSNIDLALFLMRDGENFAAPRLFKQHLAGSQSGPSIFFLDLECTLLCKDAWAHEVFQALYISKEKLQVHEQNRLEELEKKLHEM